MKKRKLVKSIVAMIALVAMLTENTCSVMASVTGEGLSGSEDAVLTVEDTDTGSIAEEENGNESILTVPDNGTELQDPDAASDNEINISIGEEQESILSETEELKEGSLNAYDDRIEADGKNELTLYINTDQMNSSDSFYLGITGSPDADYDSCLDNKLRKEEGGVYYIKGLEGKKTGFKASSLSEGLKAEYKIRRDGNPQITLISKDAPAAEKKLRVSDSGNEVKGSGYDELTITFDGTGLEKNAYFSLYIKSSAVVMYDGKIVKNGVVPSLSGSTSSIRLSGLDNEAFTIYIEGENVNNISSEYSVSSVENGAVNAVLKQNRNDVVIKHDETGNDEDNGAAGDSHDNEEPEAGEAEAVKRVYEYSDSKVDITVTLNDPADLPDNAELHAVEISQESDAAHYAEVAKKIGEQNTDDSITPAKMYVYDVFFTVDNEETEPLNPVNVNIFYKKKLSSPNNDEIEKIKTFHLKEDESGAVSSVDDVTGNVVTDGQGEVKEVTVSVDSFSDFVTVEYVSNSTLLSDGGSYSLGYILANYNSFISDSFNHENHFIGPVAVGGDASIHSWGNEAAKYSANSYIGGKLTQDNWWSTVGGGALYLGSENSGVYTYFSKEDKYVDTVNGVGINYCTGMYITDNYIDFDAAFASIRNEISDLDVDHVVDRNASSGEYCYVEKDYENKDILYLRSGYTYRISSLNGIKRIKIFGADINSAVDTILKVDSGEDITMFPDVVVGDNATTITEYGQNSSIVFLLPNTKNITMKSGHSHFGHIVAPNAFVDFPGGGSYNGCVIARKFHSANSEGHMWPYNGKKFEGATTGFTVRKTVNGVTPSSDEVFTFVLEEYKDGQWVEIQTTQNKGELASFDTIAYTKHDEGDHYYRIREQGDVNGYVIDATVYMIKVNITNEKSYTFINQNKIETCYKVSMNSSIDDYSANCIDANIVEQMGFDNKIEAGSIGLLKKTVPADAGNGTFYVTVQDEYGDYYNEETGVFDREYSEIAVKVGETRTISDIPYGTYTVTEVKDKAKDINGNEYAVSYTVDGNTKTCRIGEEDQSCTVIVNGDESVEITNRMSGQVKVTKSYLDAAGETLNDGTEFYVVLSSTSGSDRNRTAYYDINGGEHSDKQVIAIKAGETVLFAPLPAQRTYTVTETDAKGNAISDGVDFDVINGTETFVLDDSSVASLNKDVTLVNRKHATGRIEVIKKDETDGSVIDGAEFYLKHDDDSDALIYVSGASGEYIYAEGNTGTSRLTTTNGTFSVDGLPYGDYRIEEITYPDGYEKNQIVMKFSVSADGVTSRSVSSTTLIKDAMIKGSYSGSYTVYNRRKNGSLRLIKADSENAARLSGSVFELYKDGSRYPDSKTVYTTDGNGEIRVDNLPWGTYYFVEKEAPSGYVTPEEEAARTKEAVINAENCGAELTIDVVNDKIYGELLLHKVDDEDKPLTGATFKLYSSDEEKDTKYQVLTKGTAGVYTFDINGTEQELETDGEGNLTVTGLPYGTYRVYEEKAPEGYKVSEDPLLFVISERGAVKEYSFRNTLIKANVEFIKVDDKDEAIANVAFTLWKNVDGKFTKQNTYYSGKDGHVYASGLGAGTYYFTEEEITGYEVNADSYGFTITAEDNGKTFTLPELKKKVDGLAAVVNTPKTGKAELFKYVLKNNVKEPLEGAQFDLYKDGKVFKKDLKTDTFGLIRVEDLEWGNYYFTETKAPAGFTPDTTPVTFTISADSHGFTGASRLEMSNTPIVGYVELKKLDENDDETMLNGVGFDLFKGVPEGQSEKIGHYVTQNGGIAKDVIGALEYGDYYFAETDTVPGYELNTVPYTFSISEQDKLITVKAVNVRKTGKVTLEKYNSDRTKKLDGAVFELYSSNPSGILQRISAIFGKAEHKVGEYTTANGGVITVDDLAWGNYFFVETKAPKGYVLDNETHYTFTIDADNLEAELTGFKGAVDKEETGVIELTKDDGEGSALAGAKFVLYKNGTLYPDNETVYKTDGDGVIRVENLPYGSYYFVETEAPEGFVTPEGEAAKTKTVVIDENNTVSTVTANTIEVSNEKIYGSVELIKVDGNDNELAGAEFYIVKLEDGAKKNIKVNGAAGVYAYDKTAGFLSTSQTLETNGAKLSITGLPYGKYQIYESKAPEGYNRVETPFEFTVDSRDKKITTRFENTLISAGVEFIKEDADGRPLEGAEFALYKENGTEPVSKGTVTSKENGKVTVDGLGAGNYYFIETKAPRGYEPVTTPYTFRITAADNGKVVTIDNAAAGDNGLGVVYNTPRKGSVKLKKVVKGTNDGLKGAAFDLYRKGESAAIRKDLVSDENGYVRADGLEWGTYVFRETKAPSGYAIEGNGEYVFEINADNVSEEITVDVKGNELKAENKLIRGGARLVKQDSVTGSPIEGAVFTLYNAKDNTVVNGYEEIKSDAKGMIVTNGDLTAGSYYFMEKTPAPGYESNTEKYAFTIDQSNMDKIVEAGSNGIALNTPKKGKAEILKYTESEDGTGRIGLAGAEFTLYREETILGIKYFKEDKTYTTDAEGIVRVDDLLWGTYKFKETKAPAGYIPDPAETVFTIGASALDYTGKYRLSLKNEAYKGSVKLVKYYTVNGENKGTLEGAAFKFFKTDADGDFEIKNTTADGLYVTDKNGEIVIGDLAWGSYYFEEVSAPEGYAMPKNRKSGVLSINAQNVEKSIKTPLDTSLTNEKIYGNAALLKVDDQSPANALEGAEFALFTKDGSKVYVTGGNGVYAYSEKASDTKLVTPENGRIDVKQLPYGSYYFKETKAPDGYLLNDEHISFVIDRNQAEADEPQEIKTCINSTVRASVSFIKADTTKDKPLEGAVFTLYKTGAGENGTDLEISDVTSDAKGIVSYSNLGIGSYYFKEKSTPGDAYRKLTGKYTFTVTNDDNGKTLKLDNAEDNVVINYPKYGGVRLEKSYIVNGNREGTLAGAVFELYSVGEDGKEEALREYTTDSNGNVNVQGLEWGSYYFTEKSAPAGYTFDSSKKYSFSITQENVTDIRILHADNTRLTGSVELEKTDSTDNTPLSGVVFELYKNYNTADQALIATLVTENGKASRDGLLWGRYTLIEKETIDGYVLNTEQYSFTISGDHLKESFTGVNAIKNDRIRGYVELLKKDSVTKAPMRDVAFELYRGTEAEGQYVATYTTNGSGKLTDESGSEKIGPLDYGEYYFKEITPVGYIPNDDVLTFRISSDGQTVSFTDTKTVFNTPENGAVILRKTDENGAPLAGAEFTLFATTPKTIGQTLSTLFKDSYEYGTYTTNENGEIRVSGLGWDTYFFTETKAPKGYEIIEPGKRYEFTIDAFSTKTAIELGTVINKQQPGTLTLVKLDDESETALEGAQFKLYRTEDGVNTDVSAQYGATSGVFTTAADGRITVRNVAWGSYYFEETKAPEGYEEISDTNIVRSSILTVNANNADAKTNIMKPQNATVYNRKGYGYVSLKKIFDGKQPESFAGVEFSLINDSTAEKVGDYKTNEAGIIEADVIGRLPYGDYHFEEVSVPSGISYAVSRFILAFTIDRSNEEAEPVEFTFVNSEITASARFVKVDGDSKAVIPGIRFNVFAMDNSEVSVTTVVSDAAGIVMAEHLPMGEYYFLEDKASAEAAGYVADGSKYMFSITEADRPVKDADGKITEKMVPVYKEGTDTEITNVSNLKGKGTIRLIKLGRQSNGSQKQLELSGASFELYKDGELYMAADRVAEYISGQNLVIGDLPWGTYYFKEIKAPAGYALPSGEKAVTNTVTLDGTTVSGSLTTPLVCQMSDDSIRVYISKREIGGSEELPGAKLEVYEADENGKVSDKPYIEWESGTTPKLIETGNGDSANGEKGFEAGKTYVLHEDTAPAGYCLATDIVFTVNEDGTVTTNARTSGASNGMTIIMEDAAINVSISKKEMGSDTELSGAVLRILDGEETIESWVSTGKPHTIAAVLEVGKSYTLKESDPPKGYYTADPITFTLKDDGTIQIIKDASASAEASVKAGVSGNAAMLTMYDRPIRVEISKKRLSGGADDYVAGAELALYEQADNDYRQIFSWVSPVSGATLIDYGLLQVGKKYKVVETKAPAGYVKADDLYFTVKDYNEFEKTDANGMVTQPVNVYDAVVTAVVSKQMIVGGEELPGAKLQIIDETGRVVLEFESGQKQTLITSVADQTLLSSEEKTAYEKYNVIYGTKLEAGKTYILREITAPYGYALAEDISFKVDDQG
ncbi:MAG: hypothetical protein IJT37_06875, partial [Lachnospiraceae bacterium]|nr:hypothetical protein [Lachnospiraceae bacterium]